MTSPKCSLNGVFPRAGGAASKRLPSMCLPAVSGTTRRAMRPSPSMRLSVTKAPAFSASSSRRTAGISIASKVSVSVFTAPPQHWPRLGPSGQSRKWRRRARLPAPCARPRSPRIPGGRRRWSRKTRRPAAGRCGHRFRAARSRRRRPRSGARHCRAAQSFRGYGPRPWPSAASNEHLHFTPCAYRPS